MAPGLAGTVRSNILLNLPLDEARLSAVVQACCLQADIDAWQNGLDTEIGQRGITLSGGQRARLAVARAAYQDADIILLDDPLSAVDVSVARKLVENLICGFLKTKLRILVTHQTQFLDRADVIVVMAKNPNRIAAIGTHGELVRQGHLHVSEDAEVKDEGEKPRPVAKVDAAAAGKAALAQAMSKGTTIATKEQVAAGAVSASVYKKLFKYMGGPGPVIAVFLAGVGAMASSIFFDYWMSRWIEDVDHQDKDYYPGILGLALFVTMGLIFGRSLILRNTVMKGAQELHDSALVIWIFFGSLVRILIFESLLL